MILRPRIRAVSALGPAWHLLLHFALQLASLQSHLEQLTIGVPPPHFLQLRLQLFEAEHLHVEQKDALRLHFLHRERQSKLLLHEHLRQFGVGVSSKPGTIASGSTKATPAGKDELRFAVPSENLSVATNSASSRRC